MYPYPVTTTTETDMEHDEAGHDAPSLMDLPDEVLAQVLAGSGSKAVCTAAATCARFKQLIGAQLQNKVRVGQHDTMLRVRICCMRHALCECNCSPDIMWVARGVHGVACGLPSCPEFQLSSR